MVFLPVVLSLSPYCHASIDSFFLFYPQFFVLKAEREEWEREKAKLVRERDEAQSRLDGATGRLQAASTAGGRNQLAKAVNQFLSETRLGGEEGDIVAAASAPPISEKKGRFMI
jgi:hypothetical protein